MQLSQTSSEGRERRCLVSGAVQPEAKLIRFAAGPDGTVVADLAAHLPGRGMWVSASHDALAQAVRKNLFARSAKRNLKPDPELVSQTIAALRRRLLERLGLARRCGQVATGYETVHAALKAGQLAILVEAEDGAEDGRDKLLRLNHALGPIPVLGCFGREQLAQALGLADAVHLGLTPSALTTGIQADMCRLAGFISLTPTDWLVKNLTINPTVSPENPL